MMSKEASSNKVTTGFRITSTEPIYKDLEKCYPLVDLKRLLLALVGVFALFVLAIFVL